MRARLVSGRNCFQLQASGLLFRQCNWRATPQRARHQLISGKIANINMVAWLRPASNSLSAHVANFSALFHWYK
jgi:hypothetical protein